LGLLNTSVLFGGERMLDEGRSGGRVILGTWLDACHVNGLQLSYVGLASESAEFFGSDEQFSILARPFQDVVAGTQDARLVVFPELITGALSIDLSTEFQSAEAVWRRAGSGGWGCRTDFYLGYRYASLDDDVLIRELTESLAEPTEGTNFDLTDEFRTRNEFHGGQFGVRVTGMAAGYWQWELLGKMALGNTRTQTSIRGQTIVTLPNGTSSTQPAGLLAQGTNIGEYETDELGTISEASLTLRRQLGYGWSVHCGYNLLLWTDVLRAGEQIDTGINVSQIPPGTLSGEPRPEFPDATNDFWAQGLNLGLEFNY
jgi:hypothetical protein